MLIQSYSTLPTEIVSELYCPTLKKTLKCRWDTGSPRTYIKSDSFFTKPSNGVTAMDTRSGVVAAELYDIEIVIDPIAKPVRLEVCGVRHIRGADCVIGMDVIRRGDFTITMAKGKLLFIFEL